MKVLITGASSYVGAGIYSYLKGRFGVFGTYFSNKLFPELVKMDITDNSSVKKITKEIKPEVIVHVAANPSTRWCEEHKQEATLLNENGVKNIVGNANSIGSKVIFISSFAAIKPTTFYGKTKLAGEKIVKETNSGWAILRPSLIIGYSPNTTNDRPFNKILKNIVEGTPAIYDVSWKFQPSWLDHISEVIEQIIAREIYGATIPVMIPELKTRFDLANDILSKFGIKVEPVDKKDESPVYEQKVDKLLELDLPTHTYEEMINKIASDIREKVIKQPNK